MANRVKQVAIILAGGIGNRLKPLSTPEKPKQFHSFFGDRTLIQSTYDRISGLFADDQILVLGQARHVDLIQEQLPMIPREHILLEPIMRNTAPAVQIAAHFCHLEYGNPMMVLLPADHFIEPVDIFHETLQKTMDWAKEEDGIFLLGILPDRPSVDYGYLYQGEIIAEYARLGSFKEKPNEETAKQYLASGEYFWNSGMFVWSTKCILQELQQYCPDLFTAITNLSKEELLNTAKLKQVMEPLEKISIDYAVMEKSDRLFMTKAEFQWSDLGTWEAIESFKQEMKRK